PSKKAMEYAKKEIAELMLYPDPDCTKLTDAVAKRYGVLSEQVILTNGSDEVLNFAFMAYCDKDKKAVFPDLTYGFYKVFASVNGVPYQEIPLKDDFSIDVTDYNGVSGTIFIANPNAPTGLTLTIDEIESIVSANKNRVVVIDEAYVDFGAESAIKLVDKYDNLLVTQTFSKSRSMAGARLGFGIANAGIIDDLKRIKYSTNPYNVNKMTAAAGLGAILDDEYFMDNCKKIIEIREWTKTQLIDLGFTVTDSKTNFIFAKNPKISGKDLYLSLKNNGVLVRHFDKKKICDYNRITIGNFEQMNFLIDTIKKIMENFL
ncbi:MAG: histidinol-phosphate transaminase, partial [Clostridiales bacterium]|nr:histidinol-phosphate transaminase [Clostridiales bacterium]